MNIFYEFNGNKRNIYIENVDCNLDLYQQISTKENLPLDLFKIVLNGKFLAQDQTLITRCNDLFCNVILPLVGGKGGFGSMLRAIGAQIEKTTNKEACRDLSGRRLRDVNAEKRIKNWIKRKAEQEKERERKKREKLERLTQQPNIDFKDEEYLKEKDVIPQKVDEAIDYGLKKKKPTCTVTSTTSSKRTECVSSTKTKIDENNEPCSSSSDSNAISDANSNNSNDQIQSTSQPCTSTSCDSNDQPSSSKNTASKGINKRKIDEPVASKKKKVQLWLGDDLESDDSDED